MKFKAHIKLTEEQKVFYMLRFGDNASEHRVPEYLEFEFSLQSLMENYDGDTYDYDIRCYLTPWLMAGNQPEIVECEPENIEQSCFIYLIGRKTVEGMWRRLVDSGGGISNFPVGLSKKEKQDEN